MTTILLQRKEGPWKRDIEKTKGTTAFYNRFQPSAGPGNYHDFERLLLFVIQEFSQ